MTVLDSLSSNPFSSRFLRPGEIPYQWFDSKPINGESSNKTWSEVSQKFLEACKGRACIWGPHGSGKSTFLHAFLPRVSKLEACFGWTEPLQFDLEESQKRLQGIELSARLFRMTKDGSTSDILQKDVAHWNQHTLIVIDGYEQLSWLRRWWLRYQVLSKSIRLLVTSHRPSRFYPTLVRTTVTEESVEWLIRHLMQAEPGVAEKILSSQNYRDARSKWGDNAREILFEIYDWMEEWNGSKIASRHRSE